MIEGVVFPSAGQIPAISPTRHKSEEIVAMSDTATVTEAPEETVTPEADVINDEVVSEQATEASAPAEKPKPKARKTTPAKAKSTTKEKPVATATKPKTKTRARKSTATATKTRKTTAKKATAKKAKSEGVGRAEGSARGGRKSPPADVRERGMLEVDVLGVTDDFNAGKIDLDSKPLTPHRIADLITERDKLDRRPSPGAITNILKRWDEYGFALTDVKPFAFRRYSAKGEREGLQPLKEKAIEKRKAERAKAKK